MTWAQIVPTILSGGSLLTAVGMLLRIRAQNTRDAAETGTAKVDAASTLSAAALNLLKPYQDQVAELSEQLADLQLSVVASQTKATRLEQQLAEALVDVAELRDENSRYRALHGPLPA